MLLILGVSFKALPLSLCWGSVRGKVGCVVQQLLLDTQKNRKAWPQLAQAERSQMEPDSQYLSWPRRTYNIQVHSDCPS